MKKLNTLLLLLIFFASCNSDEEVIEQKPFNEFIVTNLGAHSEKIQIPLLLKESQNIYAKEAVTEFNNLKETITTFHALLTVPKSATKDQIDTNTVVYKWIGNIFGETLDIDYKITKKEDRYTFIFNISTGTISADLINGYTLFNEKSGNITYKEPNYIATTNWEIKDTILFFEFLADGNTDSFEINTINGKGKMIHLGNTYEWNEDGTGKVVYKNGDTFNW